MDPGSFILRHNLLHHSDEDPLINTITWEQVVFHIKPMERVIDEAIKIKMVLEDKDICLMNAKTDYTKHVLPGITPVD